MRFSNSTPLLDTFLLSSELLEVTDSFEICLTGELYNRQLNAGQEQEDEQAAHKDAVNAKGFEAVLV